jgi:ribosomal protein L11 methyltransferase
MNDARVVQVTTAGGVDAELAADALWRAGAVAIEERAVAGGVVLVAAAGSPDPDPGPLVEAVAGRWPAEAVPVDVDAALDAWRPHARPVAAGRFLVRPPWIPGAAGAGGLVEVVVDPGRAFGSGSHASTRLALEALGEAVAPGDRVLDVGCGSGVLAVAALVTGAAGAVGVDTDPGALAATRANAERNGVADRLTVAEAIPPVPEAIAPQQVDHCLGNGGFDLVVANMLAPTLIELAPAITEALRPGGRLVLAGLLAPQAESVLAAYPDLTPLTTYRSADWLAVSGAAPSSRRP